MNFKHFGIIILALLIMAGCQQKSNENQTNDEFEEDTRQEQGQEPGQPLQLQQGGTEVSDEELQQFAAIAQEVQLINQDIQQEMIGSVEDAGLDVQRYNEIQQARQNPGQEVEASAEELEQFNSANEELAQIQTQAQQKMEEKITEEGLTLGRYQEIIAMIQNDPNLQQKFQEILQGAL